MLGVVVDLVFGCSITESRDLSIIAVGKDSASLVFERWREKICGPEDFGRFVRSPGIAAHVLAELARGDSRGICSRLSVTGSVLGFFPVAASLTRNCTTHLSFALTLE